MKTALMIFIFLIHSMMLSGQGMVNINKINVVPDHATTTDTVILQFEVMFGDHTYEVSLDYFYLEDTIHIETCYKTTGITVPSNHPYEIELGRFEFGQYNFKISVFEPTGATDSCIDRYLHASTTGSFTVDWPVSIDEREQSANEIELHPNPSTGIQQLRISLEKSEQVAIKLFDIHGKMVKNIFEEKQEAGVSELNIDLSELPGGVYFYRVTVGEKVFFRKVVKL